MRKLKGQGTLTKFITSAVATANRRRFNALVRDGQQLSRVIGGVEPPQAVPLKLVGFSSTTDYPEQILSILSFLRYVGQPLSWTIYSDGSHTAADRQQLQTALPFVRLIDQRTDEEYFKPGTLKPALHSYRHDLCAFAQRHFLGKRLSLYLNHTIDAPTLFLDSDVLFYPQSATLRSLTKVPQRGWFLPDSGWGCLDSRYVANHLPQPYQVNAGFFLMNSELTDVQDAMLFLKDLKRTYEYFSEQTVMHILLSSNHYRPLDPRLFVVDTADQFDFSYAYDRDAIALRHYTGPVRHKMWQRDWKWHLSLA